MKIVFDDDREDIVIKSKAKPYIGNKTKDNKNEAKVNKQLKKAKKSNKK